MSAFEDVARMIEERLGEETGRWLLQACDALQDAGLDHGRLVSLAVAATAAPQAYHLLERGRVRGDTRAR